MQGGVVSMADENNPYAAKVGKRLQSIRNQRDMSQTQAAKKAGITRASLISYEQGKRLPSVESILRLSIAYTAEIDWLLYSKAFRLINGELAERENYPDTSLPYREVLARYNEETLDSIRAERAELEKRIEVLHKMMIKNRAYQWAKKQEMKYAKLKNAKFKKEV